MSNFGEDKEAVINVRNVGRRFGERQALVEISFTAQAGELIAIIGPNGAGKTTLLSILAGSLKPSSGELTHHPDGIGWVPQQPALYNRLTVRENLQLFARLAKVKGVDSVVAEMLEQADLVDRADELVSKLSGGNRQRINIAIGILSRPAVLLLDEPSTALDPRQRERLWQFVGSLAASGTTVIYSTHYVQEAERQADRVLVLADGELLFNGTPRQLEEQVSATDLDFETAFVSFLKAKGH